MRFTKVLNLKSDSSISNLKLEDLKDFFQFTFTKSWSLGLRFVLNLRLLGHWQGMIYIFFHSGYMKISQHCDCQVTAELWRFAIVL